MARVKWILLLMIPAGSLNLAMFGQTSEVETGPESLVAWKLAYFSEDELADGTSDDTTSAAADGIPNLLRYALGFQPRDPLPRIISVRREDPYLEVTYPDAPERTDVTCQLEGSIDLDSWVRIEADPAPKSNQTGSIRVHLAGFTNNDLIRFYRLRAERLIEDMDEDGLPDDHELAWFASVAHNKTDDPDQDGMSIEDELAIGRSPHRGVIIDPALARQTTGLEVFTPLE